MRALLVLGLTSLCLACEPNGLGRVDASFTTAECPPGREEGALQDYGWDAGYLVTDRFREIVNINVLEFRGRILDTDSVGIRLDLEGLEQAGMLARDGEFYTPIAPPLVVPVGDGRAQAQVLLSLFRSCERFPGYSAVGGEVRFDELRLRLDGADTGDGERLVGRVDAAPLSYTQAPAPIGTVTATFDFEPPERPLQEFE